MDSCFYEGTIRAGVIGAGFIGWVFHASRIERSHAIVDIEAEMAVGFILQIVNSVVDDCFAQGKVSAKSTSVFVLVAIQSVISNSHSTVDVLVINKYHKQPCFAPRLQFCDGTNSEQRQLYIY